MSLGKFWKGLAALGKIVSLLRGKGSFLVALNGSRIHQLAWSQGCWNEPLASVGSGYSYTTHSYLCTRYRYLPASAAFDDVRWLDFSSRMSRQDLSQHVFREHIFSNIPVFCNVHAGHVLRQLLVFSWPAWRVALGALLSQEGLVPLLDSVMWEGGSWQAVADQIQGPASSLPKDDQWHIPREEYLILVAVQGKHAGYFPLPFFNWGLP